MSPEPTILSFKPYPLQTTKLSCPSCSKIIEFAPPSSSHPDLKSYSWSSIQSKNFVFVKCWNCNTSLKINLQGHLLVANAQSKLKAKANGAGTDANPLETDYYDELMVSPTASAGEIKKAYYQLAMRYHPDKTGGDVEASERFKRISEAYQVLSDPKLRKQYNEHGKQTGPEGGFAEPAAFFKSQFGGDRFADIIGDISLFQDLESMMGNEEGNLSPEEKLKRTEMQNVERVRLREERIAALAEKLIHKLSLFTETPMDKRSVEAFEQICKLEADELKTENFGVLLLQSIGHTYTLKAKQYLSNSIGSMWHSMTEKKHIVSETMSTVKSAVKLSSTFKQLNEANEKGNLTDDERIKLEESAAQRGFDMLWKGSKMEVQSILREVCDKVLGEKSLAKEKVHARATALKILGQVYESVEGENISMLNMPFGSGDPSVAPGSSHDRP